MNANENKQLVVRITVKADKKYLPTITKFVSDIARIKGFPEEEIKKLEGVTEEACLNVIEQSYAAGEDAYFDVSVERRPGQLVVAIEDNGLPFDLDQLQKDQNAGIGLALIKAFTDEIRFINKGREGKRMEFIKNLTMAFSQVEPVLSEDLFVQTADLEEEEESADPSTEKLNLRIMKADEGLKLSRLVYRTSSTAYDDDVYYPERMKTAILSGTQTSLVVENTQNEFVGHLALVKTEADSKVAEITKLVIDPSYADRDLFAIMQKQTLTLAKKKMLFGVFAEASADNVAEQRQNIELGAKLCGFIAGDHAKNKEKNKKCPKLMVYFKSGEGPKKKVYAPYQHKTIIEKIYANIGVMRDVQLPLGQMPSADSASTVMSTKVIEGLGIGYIMPGNYGHDFTDVLKTHLHSMLEDGINCVYLDLSLEDPLAVILCSMVEMLGFFFAAVIPDTASGDVVRMQYVIDPNVKAGEQIMEIPFIKEVIDYVTKASSTF